MYISVVVPVYNKIEIIQRCLELNIAHAASPCEWIVIDNASDEPTRAGLLVVQSVAHERGHSFTIYRESVNTGVAVAWNKGLGLAHGQYVCILNNDCVMQPNWDHLLISSTHDLITPFVLESWMFHYPYSLEEFLNSKENWEYISKKNKHRFREGLFGGVVIFGKKKVFDAVGPFDEKFWLSLEEMDYLVRAKQLGFQVGTIGAVTAFHFSGATRNTMKTDGGAANQRWFESKWGWNFEKEESKFYNKLIRSVLRRTWDYFRILAPWKMKFPIKSPNVF